MTYTEAYLYPLLDLGIQDEAFPIAAYRFCRDLSIFGTGVSDYRTLRAINRRKESEASYAVAKAQRGSPFCTITGPAGVTTGQSD